MIPQIPQSLQAPHLENLIPYGDFSKNPWQEGTSFAAITSGTYTADLLKFNKVDGAVYSVDKFSDHADGVGDSWGLTVTTLDATFTSNEYSVVTIPVEGYDFKKLLWGTASAKKLTVAFDVKCSEDGTYTISFQNHAADRAYVHEFVIDSADTWQTITVTLPGDTTGTWEIGTNRGLLIAISPQCGSDFHATAADTWEAGNKFGTSGMTNTFKATVSNTFRIADFRAYPVDVDLGAHYPDVGEVLRYCRRYYTRLTFDNGDPITIGQDYSASGTIGNVSLPVTMRTTNPTPIHSAPSTFKHIGATGTPLAAFTTIGTWFASEAAVRMNLTGGSGGTAGNASEIQAASAGCYIGADARW
jgi:hypothetical protein